VVTDLKPDNIGFTTEGQLKLFDFGLMACVKKRSSSTQAYEMTGNTGTLVHMAPEVALRKPYTEKVDIYSIGVILWQLTSGEVLFPDMKRDEYMARVVNQGMRPLIKDDLPEGVSRLIQRCWDTNPAFRPSSEELLRMVDMLYGNGKGSGLGGIAARAKTPPHSSGALAASASVPRLFHRNNGRVVDESLSLSLLSTMAVKSLQAANDKPVPTRKLAGGPTVSAIRMGGGH
jgi:serine/threonine protein kinase